MEIIETKRLQLRGLIADDRARLLQLFNEDPIIALMMGDIPYPFGEKDADAYITSLLTLPPPAFYRVVATKTEPNTLIGLYLCHCFGEADVGAPGLWIAQSHRGQSFALEFMIPLLNHGFFTVGFNKMRLNYRLEAIAPQRLYHKLGFRQVYKDGIRCRALNGQLVPVIVQEMEKAAWLEKRATLLAHDHER